MEKLTESNRTKTSGGLANKGEASVLKWEVFVTPGIPIVMPDRPPGVRETFFQATADTLVYGTRDALPGRHSGPSP